MEKHLLNRKHAIPLHEKLLEICHTFMESYRSPFFTGLIVGLLSYTFAFTNKLLNWDEICSMFSKGATIGSGRWALPITSLIFPDYSMPWINGIISIVLISLSACILLNELKIKYPILQSLFSGLVVASPVWISTASFMFTFSPYALGFCLSAVAVSCARKDKWEYKILGIGLSVFSMGIYQSFLAVTSSFLLVCMAGDILTNRKDFKTIIREGLYYVFHLGLSCIIYLLISAGVQYLCGETYNAYAQERMDFSGVFSLQKFKRLFTVLITELLDGQYSFMSTPFARVLHCICVLLSGICILYWLFQSKNKSHKFLMAIILFLLPISIDSFILIVSNSGIQTMLFYSFASVYGLICVIFDNLEIFDIKLKIKNLFYDIVVFSFAVVIACNVFVSNRTFLQMYISNLNVYSFYTSLSTRIQENPEFINSDKIALIGETEQYQYDLSDFWGPSNPQVRGAVGIDVNVYSRKEFLKYFIGFDIDHATDEEVSVIIETAEFSEMPIYPYEGSIQRIGDIIVVKFSDPLAENDQP